ncbi:MAG: mandelate racemase/muconate lactonizing enzyme family protein [Hyphomicrobiaceae bacterium]
MKIVDIKVFPTSFPLPQDLDVRLGIGRMVKRDTVIVKVVTESGLVGWGESHHGRAPGTVAHLVGTTLKQLILGMDASDVVGIWSRIYKMQLGSHGMGAGTSLAMSGIDMALWDIRAKAVGWPLYKLLGGRAKRIPAYAGGVALGYQPPERLVDEVRPFVEAGYKAVKLRVGDSPERDIERAAAVRKAFGSDLVILSDANTGCSVEDARRLMPGLEDAGVAWLEEPFPAHDYRSYAIAKSFARVPLAAGENHYTRFEFNRLIEDGAITILQPDLSKTGGITEALRIAAMASAWKLPVNPHTSISALNMAASIHFLCAIDNGGYYEADISKINPYRDLLCSKQPCTIAEDGSVSPLEAPGIGLDVDEKFLLQHPVIEGPSYV